MHKIPYYNLKVSPASSSLVVGRIHIILDVKPILQPGKNNTLKFENPVEVQKKV